MVDPTINVGVNFLEGRLSDKTNIAVGSKVITQKLNAEESKLIMNNFKQKALISALAGAGALAMAGAANAVYVNQDGLGQALVYPYYTVRGGNVTLVSVVNTTTQAKAVKVRFLEGKNSVEVLDFNLFLSAKDVWTGAILPTTAGAAIYTGDRSCTNPRIPAGGVEFRNTLFLNDAAALQSLDRTREGYVEMLEMATIPNATALGVAVTHVNGTAPCTTARINDAGFTSATGLAAPSGGLFGNGTILNALGGASTGYEATAFDGWTTRIFPTNSGSLFPNLASGSSRVSVVNNNGNVYVANWLTSIDAVSATIMHSSVYGEYAFTKDNVIGTDWIITMPTKNQYVSATSVQLRSRTHTAHRQALHVMTFRWAVMIVKKLLHQRLMTSPRVLQAAEIRCATRQTLFRLAAPRFCRLRTLPTSTPSKTVVLKFWLPVKRVAGWNSSSLRLQLSTAHRPVRSRRLARVRLLLRQAHKPTSACRPSVLYLQAARSNWVTHSKTTHQAMACASNARLLALFSNHTCCEIKSGLRPAFFSNYV